MSNNLVPVLLLFFFFIFFLTTTKSIATESKQSSSSSSIIFSPVNQLLNETSTYLNFPSRFNNPNIELSTSTIIAAALSFLAASISSAGGIGGGGLYVPIMTIVAGLDLKTASSFSAFMVTGGSVANVGCNLFATNARSGKALIDFDLALLLEPCMLIGVSVGVICNLVFPNWLVTLLFAVFLAWSTVKTFRNGLFYWNLETEIEKKKNRGGGGGDGDDVAESVEVALLGDFEREKEKRFPWIKLGVLVVIWFSYFGVYLLRGNQKGEGIISIEPCGITYWLLSSTQIPLTLFFTLWICFSDNIQSNQSSDHQVSSVKDIEDLRSNDRGCSNKCMFPVMALLAGVLGGVFGIGGGMLISPLLLQVGIAPEVTAATCSFMVLFSSTMSAIQYLLLGMEHTGTASIFAVVCFVASLVGLMVVQKVITEYGRASIIVFSVGIVMALSIVLMTSYGVLDIWNDFVSGSYMGFKLPC